jgi:hypothetical protein
MRRTKTKSEIETLLRPGRKTSLIPNGAVEILILLKIPNPPVLPTVSVKSLIAPRGIRRMTD